MPKFQIELELSSINDRLLLTNFDSSEKLTGGLTFNESLSEEENDRYSLTFSIAKEFGHTHKIDISRLISIGRPVWLHLYNENQATPYKQVRMVIASFSSVIGNENVVFDIQCDDYASYAFSKNNVGFTLNTFEDEDFIDWAEENNRVLSPKIKDIADYILQRGWLQYQGPTLQGWTVEVDNWIPSPNPEGLIRKSDLQINLEVSSSNTYGSLVELANLTNTFLEFDYSAEKVYFWNRENLNFDKNYQLKRDFNLQDYATSFSGSELYSIFYADAAEDEFGLKILLSEETDYLDNFIFDFSYFTSRELITDESAIQTLFNTQLKDINQRLQTSIKDRFNLLGRIREARARIESLAEIVAAPASFEGFAQRYLDLKSQFYRPSLGTKQVPKDEGVKILNVLWDEILPTHTVEYPINFNYSGVLYRQENESQVVQTPLFEIRVVLEQPAESFIEFESESGKKVFLIVNEKTNVEFDIRRFIIETVNISIRVDEDQEALEFIFPLFDLLNKYDGFAAIDQERARIIQEIEFFEELRDEDLLEINCLLDPEFSSECANITVSENPAENLERIALLESRLDDYVTVLGRLLDESEFTGDPTDSDAGFVPGKLTLIRYLFDEFKEIFDEEVTAGDIEEVNPTAMDRYRAAQKAKQKFWFDLKEKRQHVFLEGYYENDFESNAATLKEQATAIFKEHNRPQEDFNLTYIDISDVVGVSLENIRVGDFVSLNESQLQSVSSEESKLKVAAISKVLRDKANISLTIYKYNMINQILDKIIAKNQ